MNWDGLVGFLIGALLTALALTFFMMLDNKSKCEAKGGAYVSSQCLKVEVIK